MPAGRSMSMPAWYVMSQDAVAMPRACKALQNKSGKTSKAGSKAGKEFQRKQVLPNRLITGTPSNHTQQPDTSSHFEQHAHRLTEGHSLGLL